jgi:hypothetical protein
LVIGVSVVYASKITIGESMLEQRTCDKESNVIIPILTTNAVVYSTHKPSRTISESVLYLLDSLGIAGSNSTLVEVCDRARLRDRYVL